jgi:osmotically-inducible protein OsmY
MDSSNLNHSSAEVERDEPGTGGPTHGVIGHLSSDEELQQAVCAALLRTPGLDARGIQVAVLGHGEVTLIGRVPTVHEKALAVRVARDCAGGRSVHADLAVAAAV